MVATPITAYACCNALGASVTEVVEATMAGASGLVEDRTLDPEGRLRFGKAPGVEALPFSLAAFEGATARLLAHVAKELIEPVKVASQRWSPDRVAVVLGVDSPNFEALRTAVERSISLDHAALDARGPGGLATLLSTVLETRGPAFTVSAEGASGALAVATAHRLIEADLVDAAIVGGAGTLSAPTIAAWESRRLLARGVARPLSGERQGACIGEGAALLLIERHGDAFVEIRGAGEARGEQGIDASIGLALGQARVEPSRAGYVHMHGLGTITHDFAESEAVVRVFGEDMIVAATQGATGCIHGAAGASELVLAAAALEDGRIPPTVGCEPVDAALRLRPSARARELEHDLVVLHSASLCGRHAAIVLGASDS